MSLTFQVTTIRAPRLMCLKIFQNLILLYSIVFGIVSYNIPSLSSYFLFRPLSTSPYTGMTMAGTTVFFRSNLFYTYVVDRGALLFFSSLFIYSCVLSSVFYTIDELLAIALNETARDV